ncbi:MAG: spore maturation protein [Candidatus Sumerlaeota bacterium]|nr:spore maturation protein [Candidatus Sumerlaeota bacterium]
MTGLMPYSLTGFICTSELLNSWIIPLVFLFIVAYGCAKKVKVYEAFVSGAKEGFNVAVMIIPYLVVILSAIAIFRANGAMNYVAEGLGYIISPKVFPPDTILLALIKPLSGGAARGVMLDIFQRHGVDSFTGFLASTIQGSTETTFYVVAVYYGSIGVVRTRHTIPVGLAAEIISVTISIFLANLWYAGMR